MRTRATVVSLAIVLSACAARGPLYLEDAANQTAIPPDRAALVVYRTKATTQYSGAWATISVDGSDVGSVEWGGFTVFPITPGSHVVGARQQGSPVSCAVSVELVGGLRSFFEVSPRVADYFAHIPSMLVGSFIPFVGIPMWYAEELVEAHGKTCGGGFAIEAVGEATALSRLYELQASRASIEARAPQR